MDDLKYALVMPSQAEPSRAEQSQVCTNKKRFFKILLKVCFLLLWWYFKNSFKKSNLKKSNFSSIRVFWDAYQLFHVVRKGKHLNAYFC